MTPTSDSTEPTAAPKRGAGRAASKATTPDEAAAPAGADSAAPDTAVPDTAAPDTAAAEAAPAPEAAGTTTDPATELTADTSDAAPADGEPGEEAPEKRRRGRPKGSTAKTTRTIELTLTVSGTVDGDWQAELKQGSSWLSRGLPVTSAAVQRAAKELHPELAEPIDTAIGAAREQRAARVAALEAELEQARKALAELDG
jgi:hypothetical protein